MQGQFCDGRGGRTVRFASMEREGNLQHHAGCQQQRGDFLGADRAGGAARFGRVLIHRFYKAGIRVRRLNLTQDNLRMNAQSESGLDTLEE